MTGVSRYTGCPELTRVEPDGRPVRYLGFRILPQGASIADGPRTAVAADEVDRLDLIAWRRLGNVALAYRIADANDAIDPFAICDRVGQPLNLPGSAL